MMNQEFMDIINLLSFYIGVKNLDENLTQNNASELLEKANNDIHEHLVEQDKKLDLILKRLEDNTYDKN